MAKRLLCVITLMLALVCVLASCGGDKHTHSFGEWIVTKEAGCTEDGIEERTCTCGEKETRSILAKHNFIGNSCSKCGESAPTVDNSDNNLESGGNNEPQLPDAPETPIEPETPFEPENPEHHEHTFGEWTEVIAPTCTQKGCERRICSNCGFSETQDVNALGHAYSNWTLDSAPTCENEGNESRYCETCSHFETRVLSPNGHTPTEAIVENKTSETCTTDGSYDNVVYCSVCNAEISRETKLIAKLGHNYNTVVTPPTKTTDGYTTHTCSLCQDTYTDSNVPAIGSEGLVYEVNSDGTTCRITGIGSCADTNVFIPSIINGLTVTAIADKAFAENTTITFVTIPNTVTDIGRRAFYKCEELKIF